MKSVTMNSLCQEHGCPLPGVFQRDEKIVCWLHDTTPPEHSALVSETIRANESLVAVIRAVSSAPEWDREWIRHSLRALTDHGRPDLCRRRGESRIAFLVRLRSELTDRVDAVIERMSKNTG